MMNNEPSLSIVIVNWNTGDLLRDCVNSIVLASKEGFQLDKVVVVDNASSGGSFDGLNNFNLPLVILRNDENRGFSTACNQGADVTDADYLLFLNPDTRLFTDALSKPLKFLRKLENNNVGILGIQHVDEAGRIERTCARFPTARRFFFMMLGLNRLLPRTFPGHFMTEWDHKESRYVDQVMGSFFLVRGSLFRALGKFDERFFVYFEEVDFSLRATRSGYRSFYFAEAAAFHKGGGSSEKVKALRLFFSLRSRILYSYKHFSWLAATLVALGTLLIEPVTRLVLAVLQFSIEEIKETIQGYIHLWRVAPQLILHARRSRA